MAGISWIKIETTLPNKPVVLTLRRLLKKSQNEVVGMLVRLLCWADGVTDDGTLRGLIVDDLDTVVDCDGFGAALLQAGWLTQGEDLSFSEWDRHNGANAKKRAMTARRVEKMRNADVTQEIQECNATSVTDVTQVLRSERKLDKIRINKSANALNAGACACEDFADSGTAEVEAPERDTRSGAAELCKAYPKRTFLNATVQAAYDGCLADGITHEVLMECLRLEKLTPAWCEQDGRYIPKLVVWLNERRFEPHLKQAQRVKPAVTRNKQALIDDLPEGI